MTSFNSFTNTQIETQLYLKTDFETCMLNNKPQCAKLFITHELYWRSFRLCQIDNIKFILENNILPDDGWLTMTDEYGKTPMMYAVKHNNKELIDLLGKYCTSVGTSVSTNTSVPINILKRRRNALKYNRLYD